MLIPRGSCSYVRRRDCDAQRAGPCRFLHKAISPRTVGKHLELLYRDLGVDSRTAAIARVNEVGG